MDNCFFSIVIPVFDVEKYIEQCLQSILQQPEEDWELILVDDGSTDGSPVICDRYQKIDSRIRVFHKNNEGPLIARVYGYSLCSGKYVISVDADDRLEKEALSILRCRLTDVEPDVLIFNYLKMTHNGKNIQRMTSLSDAYYEENDKDALLLSLLKQKSLNTLWSKVFKRELLQSHLHIDKSLTNVRSGDDLILVLPLLIDARTIITIHDSLYLYRMVPDSITHSFHKSRVDDLILSRTYLLTKLQKAGLLSNEMKADVYRSIYETASNLLWNCGRSSVPINEKIDYIKYLDNQKLYKVSLPYGRGIYTSTSKKFSLWLFEHKRYRGFVFFEQMLQLVKSVKNYLEENIQYDKNR